MSSTTGRESDKFMLRLPDGLRDRIKAVAEKNNRSMNAEIVGTLEAYYPRRMTLHDIRDYLKDLTEIYKQSPSSEILDEIQSMVELVSEKLSEDGVRPEERRL